MGKKNIDPDERAYWAKVGREVREMYERRLKRDAELKAEEERHKARLRRLTFGLLGR